MIPFALCLAGFLIVIICAQMGMRMGAFLSLSGMLGALIGAMAAMRYLFFASDAIESEKAPVPLHTVIVFWAIFCAVAFLFSRLRQLFIDVIESTEPSILGRILGTLFGACTGTIIMAAVMMTLSIALPEFWPAYDRAQLPAPVDQWAIIGYRFVETNIAGIAPRAPGHTLLPVLSSKTPATQLEAWK
jgi:hypothetical protein